MKKVFFAISSFLSDISAATGKGGGGGFGRDTKRPLRRGSLSLPPQPWFGGSIPQKFLRSIFVRGRDSDCEGARPEKRIIM